MILLNFKLHTCSNSYLTIKLCSFIDTSKKVKVQKLSIIFWYSYEVLNLCCRKRLMTIKIILSNFDIERNFCLNLR